MGNSLIIPRLDQLGEQMASMLHHVAEVRTSNHRLEDRLTAVEKRLSAVEERMTAVETTLLETRESMERKFEAQSQAFDRLVGLVGGDLLRIRRSVDDTAHERLEDLMTMQLRFKDIETRIDRLEEATSVQE